MASCAANINGNGCTLLESSDGSVVITQDGREFDLVANAGVNPDGSTPMTGPWDIEQAVSVGDGAYVLADLLNLNGRDFVIGATGRNIGMTYIMDANRIAYDVYQDGVAATWRYYDSNNNRFAWKPNPSLNHLWFMDASAIYSGNQNATIGRVGNEVHTVYAREGIKLSTVGGQARSGNGVPSAGLGNIGDIYVRVDGAAGTAIYYKGSGGWAAIA